MLLLAGPPAARNLRYSVTLSPTPSVCLELSKMAKGHIKGPLKAWDPELANHFGHILLVQANHEIKASPD